MVRRNREEIGDGCAYSVYADRLLNACDEIDRLREHHHVEDGWCMQCGGIGEERADSTRPEKFGGPPTGGDAREEEKDGS